MVKPVLFFQGGGGQDDYEADARLVASLEANLGAGYSIHYPLLPDNETPDLGRREQIGHEISASQDNITLVGHSLGASMLLVYLSETEIKKKIRGIFLISTPYWQGPDDWVKPYKLQADFAKKLDQTTPLFFYHCRDDEEVPFHHMTMYKQQLPWATFREIAIGGHHLNNDLTIVANDLKLL